MARESLMHELGILVLGQLREAIIPKPPAATHNAEVVEKPNRPPLRS